LVEYIKSKLSEEVIKTSEIASEVTFQIPQHLSHQFTTFFEAFDAEIASLGARSYGISVPTLEDVFLRVTKEQDVTENKNNIKGEDFLLAEHQTQNKVKLFFSH
jgi:hypothetical protein